VGEKRLVRVPVNWHCFAVIACCVALVFSASDLNYTGGRRRSVNYSLQRFDRQLLSGTHQYD